MTIELKDYQRRTLERLGEFLALAKLRGISSAYAEVARRLGADGTPENPYAARRYESPVSELSDCPHVCVRIPTGGGKTLLAAHCIPLAARFMEREFPTVLWMVTSDSVRRQTAGVLKDPRHPCRSFLDGAFGHRVEVLDIGDFDAVSAEAMFGKACVIVSSIQMFRSRAAEARRVYRPHEALDPHFARLDPGILESPELEKDEAGKTKRSFANLLRAIRPAIISDEAHNVVTEKSRDVLRKLRPSCVLEFTATPREESDKRELLSRRKHNVLASVPARELREAEMIRLPLRLTEHPDWRGAVNAAVMERRRLEEIARESGEPVRPIVLYQAESRIAGDSRRVTWDVLREHLLEELGEESAGQVAVETGDVRELEGADLLSPECEVRHVITVQALREGWDCPFAYVLCSVADVSSYTAAEQIMGRVLRMPFARARSHPALNLAYAHAAARDYATAAQAIREQLAGQLGFEEEELPEAVERGLPGLREEPDEASAPLYGVTIAASQKPDFGELDDESREVVREFVEVKPRSDGGVSVVVREEIPAKAREAIVRAVSPEKRKGEKARLENFIRRLERSASPSRRGVKFAPLPQLKFKSDEDGEMRPANADEFYGETDWNALGKECVLAESEFAIEEKGQVFEIRLSAEDRVVYEGAGRYQLPLAETGGDDRARLARWLESEVRDPEGRYFPETLRELVRMNLEALSGRGLSLARLSRAKYQLAEALRRKLAAHGRRALEKAARRILFGEAPLRAEFDFEFPSKGYQYNRPYSGDYRFCRHYYPVVGDLAAAGEEFRCAQALDSLDEVRHWIRNVPQKPGSYRMPLAGGANFYPDFVAELTNGKLLVVEYKGGHLMSDAEPKRECGELMEQAAAGEMFFLMPSEEDGRPTVREQLRAKIAEIMKAA